MNGCKNKSSFFEWKGARGGGQASGLGMDKVWARKEGGHLRTGGHAS